MKTILIIEDNLDVRENIAEILELSGYKTLQAENGKIGVQMAKEHKPNLIICDVMMPELDGFGVLKILNGNPTLMHIPFMFLTAKAEKSDFRKGMGLGADDYITKPFDDMELLDAIELRLKKSESILHLSANEEGIKKLYNEAKANKEFENLSTGKEIKEYRKKDHIYEVNQYAKSLYFVVSGQVKCYQTNEFGKELILNLYGPNQFFGFLPLISNSKYEDTAQALEDTVIRVIPKADFQLLIFNNRDFAAKFIQMLANQVEHSEKQLLEFAYSSVRKRVANALLTLSQSTHSDTLKVLREDVAQLAGTAKETLIRTLSDFKSEHLIKIKGGEIQILDKETLSSMPQ